MLKGGAQRGAAWPAAPKHGSNRLDVKKLSIVRLGEARRTPAGVMVAAKSSSVRGTVVIGSRR
ncbi:MAG: hypothetical protein ACR2OB_07280 [Solirubrobacteraceae bacterium]